MQTFLVPEDSEADMDDDTQALLTSDFELGHYIRERIVPRAVLYYTGNNHEYYNFLSRNDDAAFLFYKKNKRVIR